MTYMPANSNQNLEYIISMGLERNEVYKVETGNHRALAGPGTETERTGLTQFGSTSAGGPTCRGELFISS